MIIDTSVLIALILKEPGFEDLVFKMAEADDRLLSAASYLEASIVLLKKRGEGIELELDRLIYETEIAIVPVTASHVRIAREAYAAYGKGYHPAKLNFGDCFSYAFAKSRGEPLLFNGNDFSQTDILKA
jgi:ribonuclease VapC